MKQKNLQLQDRILESYDQIKGMYKKNSMYVRNLFYFLGTFKNDKVLFTILETVRNLEVSSLENISEKIETGEMLRVDYCDRQNEKVN